SSCGLSRHTLLKIPSLGGAEGVRLPGWVFPVRDNPPLHPSQEGNTHFHPWWCRTAAWMAPLRIPLIKGGVGGLVRGSSATFTTGHPPAPPLEGGIIFISWRLRRGSMGGSFWKSTI